MTVFGKKPLEKLASNGELMAYNHDGFWHPMDTLRISYILRTYMHPKIAHGKYGKTC